MKEKTLSNPAFAKKIIEFLDIAFKDYIAARVLLLQALLPQGAVLASTAVEKYFKAILAFRGNESHGHLKAAQFNAVKHFDQLLGARINDQFVSLLQKCYQLRYVDNLAPDFNLIIAQREFLAELDWTAVMIDASFHLKRGDQEFTSSLDRAKKDGDGRLMEENFVFSGAHKQEFIAAAPQSCYAVRNRPDGLLQATFAITPRSNDGQFLRPAFVPQEGERGGYFLGFDSVLGEEAA